MSSTDRQNRLLLTEDWKRIYQSFKNADFQSYDFDNLRRVMINYLRENYPEDFNDYIESSEYLALIDLIAFLGQNLSFRVDLNARENFLELAERRESVLRLARLLSYNSKRNQAANGLLKIESVSTTEGILDSNGLNLAGQTVLWNDPSNINWFEQFTRVLNAAMEENVAFGSPNKFEEIQNIPTEQYRLRGTNTGVPVYAFKKVVQGIDTRFEIVSADLQDGKIQEETPFPGRNFALLYRNDGQGSASTNSGFFVHFKQGLLDQGQFSITNPVNNQSVAINAPNINNSDVWLYNLDDQGRVQNLWTKVEAVEGNNVIYNSLSRDERRIFAVQTRAEDRINLLFADGVFGDLPKGNFRVYYRTSANRNMQINPGNMINISFDVPYIAKSGTGHTLTVTCELKYTVNNASVSETNASIKRNAPATYYTQNRMVTAEDYNVAPLTISQEIVKSRAVNRVSSGISRYFDLIDATGKYSKTNLYGNDGVLYKEIYETQTGFEFNNQTDVEAITYNTIEPIIKSRDVSNFYYDKFPRVLVRDLNATWDSVSSDLNRSSGFLLDITDERYRIGTFTENNLRLIKSDTLVKFVAPAGFHFMSENNNQLMQGPADHPGSVNYIWTKIIRAANDGTELQSTGLGPIIVSDNIPTGAILSEVVVTLASGLTGDVRTQIIDQIFAYQRFGLRYDVAANQWRIVRDTDLNVNQEFSIGKAGDRTGQNLDSSWLLLFETNGINYTVTTRSLRYVFESEKEIKFYYDKNQKIYDTETNTVVKDQINVLSINRKPDVREPFNVDYDWEIVSEFRNEDGYVVSNKLVVGFLDSDSDGVVDNPDLFQEIVQEDVNPNEKFIFLEKFINAGGSEEYRYLNNSTNTVRIVASQAQVGPLDSIPDMQVYYFYNEDLFKHYQAQTQQFVINNNYKVFTGRNNIKFQYVHNASYNNRIDPSASNIIDVYLLTKTYDTNIRRYLKGVLTQEPLPPSPDELFRSFGGELSNIKSLSDEIIYHPVRYRILFGARAEADLQGSFKVVKNPDRVLNDNDVKTRVTNAINQFFALENWDFGDTFYFSELSTYVVNQLAPDISQFILIPKQSIKSFGSLYEIKSESGEIFLADVTVNDCEIIDEITAEKIKAQIASVTTTTPTRSNVGIQSSPLESMQSLGGYSFNTGTTSTTSGSTGGGYN